MALLQISEPGQSPEPHQRIKYAAGIDLGTTNSLIATVRDGDVVVLPDEADACVLPSVVHYGLDEKGEVFIEVGAKAEQFITRDAHNTISSVKRLMGRNEKEMNLLGGMSAYRFSSGEKSGMPKFLTCQGEISPVQVSSEILKVLKFRAENALKNELDGAVITVPAYFDDAQRQATKDAARLAGLHVLRLLNEPTAAAIAYGLDKTDTDKIIAVYDLGGGTFDISILKLGEGVFRVLATGGNSSLGGDDIDHVIAEWILEKSAIKASDKTPEELRHLQQIARGIKEKLTTMESTAFTWEGYHGEITRKIMETLCDSLVRETLRACKNVLDDAGLDYGQIDEIIMVGGATRTPFIQEQVKNFFGKKPLTHLDPDRVVAMGAAMQADILVGNSTLKDNWLLLDVVPLSLGLETMGGLMEKVIHRNATIPLMKAQEFTTHKDGQVGMVIHVFQGERELVKDNRSLARFVLGNIPPMPAGAARVRVTFQVDADGLLSVTAREQSSQHEASIEVKPSYGLSDGEMRQMLEDSFEQAGYDKRERALRERRVEAERLLEALRVALEKDGDKFLSTDERNAIYSEMASLEAVSANERNAARLAEAMEKVGQISETFAARRMNAGIRKMLSGHSIDEFKE